MTAKWGVEKGSAESTRWSSSQTVYREGNESNNRQRQRPKRRGLEVGLKCRKNVES